MHKPNTPLRYRQIHLDFHTSEHIPAVGAEFDAGEFVSTLKAAHVDSITVFAKCHHGWSYYPTKVGAPHPNLARPDLLGEMVSSLKAADIEVPIYISVQWDERNARIHPEWRVFAAGNRLHHALQADPSAGKQLSPAWHTLCLNHAAYRKELLDQTREVIRAYEPPGIFFDIILTPDCVCAACLESMEKAGLDPNNPTDRLKNDEAVNETFRSEMSAALDAEFPGVRIFYNCGHIDKHGPERFKTYSHLEIESLPTGGWGYDHFPSGARYAAFLGLDTVSHTGKFHTSWGEFGGFKHPDALEYEAAQMVALGVKCLVGDQLHPSGRINRDTYASIAPAYRRIEALEPFLKGARQVTEVAVLSAEHFHQAGARNAGADDGAVQMLLELKRTFDVVDPTATFSNYPLVILPDNIPVDGGLAKRLADYVAKGGKVIATGTSGIDPDGKMMPLAGVTRVSEPTTYNPTYLRQTADHGLTETPFVVYGQAQVIKAAGAEVLAEVLPPYFNRTFRHFSSHQHAPDNSSAAPIGAGITLNGNVGYIAYPIFEIYRAYGQPLYRHALKLLLDRLLPDPVIATDLTSSGRATLTRQAEEGRHILHLLYGPPQVRGKGVPNPDGSLRVMEMIEDIPALGPVTSTVRVPKAPTRVYDALSGAAVDWRDKGEGKIEVRLPRLHIHAAIVLEGTG